MNIEEKINQRISELTTNIRRFTELSDGSKDEFTKEIFKTALGNLYVRRNELEKLLDNDEKV